MGASEATEDERRQTLLNDRSQPARSFPAAQIGLRKMGVMGVQTHGANPLFSAKALDYALTYTAQRSLDHQFQRLHIGAARQDCAFRIDEYRHGDPADAVLPDDR